MPARSKKFEDYDGIMANLAMVGRKSGPLAGLNFAVKDLFDVKGHVAGAGNPDWFKSHTPAERTAEAVARILAAGASLVAKTCSDEMAYSLDGINIHYGTPVNPQDRDRIPGGSSSGSASVVASKLVDFALGTDTGGSVRVPASYCGIFGFRPSHGRVSVEGVVPLAPVFDTVGWFARNARLLELVGSVLLGENRSAEEPVRLCIVQDAFDLLNESLYPIFKSATALAARRFSVIEEIELSPDRFESWSLHYRTLQSWQAWHSHGEWITEVQPKFAPSIEERFDFAQEVTREQMKEAYQFQRKTVDFLDHLLRGAPVLTGGCEWRFPETTGATVLCMPTTWNVPPFKTATYEDLLCNRATNMRLTCLAGLAGLPQVTVPIRISQSMRLGLSFLARKGADMMLLKLARSLAGSLEGL